MPKVNVDFQGIPPEDVAGIFSDMDRELERELADAAKDIGARFEGEVKRNIRANDQIDTGRMLNSIEFDQQKTGAKVIRVMVGTNVHYAQFQERLQPFLEPVFASEGEWAKQRVQQAIESARDKALP